MAVAAVAPLGMSASASTPQGEVEVKYASGVLIPDEDQTGDYFVTIPADVTFTQVGEVVDMSVKLNRYDTNKVLNAGLKVQVSVFSEHDYKLADAANNEADYDVRYGMAANTVTNFGGTENTDFEILQNATPDITTTNNVETDGAVLSAVLVPGADNNTTSGATEVGYIEGEAELMSETTASVAVGTVFSDTLTYHVKEIQ